MNIIVWAIQLLLAAMFAMAGYGKISNSKEQHIADRHIKPNNSVVPIRILGVLEWLGCIGITVPWFTGISPVLTPVSAVGFCLIMIAGIVNHTLRKEYNMLPLLAAIFMLSAFVAYARFTQLNGASGR